MSAANPCLDCGACCASFRVSFYWSEAEARGLPAEMTEQVEYLEYVIFYFAKKKV